MNLFPHSRLLTPRQTFTGLGLILAAAASPVHAGWDCSLDGSGEWQCQAASVNTVESGATITSAPDADAIQAAEIEAVASEADASANAEEATAETTTDSETTTETTAEESADPLSPTRVTQLRDDWVPIEKLTEAQKQELTEAQGKESSLCCGMYVDPVNAADNTDPASAEVNAHADETDTDMANQISTLKGNVQISQGYRYLRADSATLQKNPQHVTLEGNVTLREPGLLLTGDKADIQIDENTAQVENVQYLMHRQHIHGSAESLGRSDTGVIAMTDASYSYCPVDDEQWALKARSLTLDPNDSQGRARDVTLRVKDVPVFYTPYLQFPLGNQRMSGLLVPSFGTGEDGVDMQTPYYFNLAPDYDLTLTPRYIGDRGLMLGSKFRHMTENTQSSFITSFLPNDNKANTEQTVVYNPSGTISIDEVPDQRWLMQARHDGAAEKWESLVNISAVSDAQYFHDFSNTGIRGANTSQLRKEGEFDYLPENWRVGVQAKEYQTLDPNLAVPHQVMPSLFADGTYVLESGPVINLHQAMTEFDHVDTSEYRDLNRNGIEDSLDTGVRDAPVYYDLEGRETVPISGRRYNMNYNIALPLRSAGAFVTPTVGLRHVSQELDQTTINTPDSNPSTTAGFASVDSGLIFERDAEWFGRHYRQTLEPRLFYYYSQQKNQDDIYSFDSNSLTYSYTQLFRDYRLAGEDFIDDANQISAGVSSRLLSPTTGRELVRVGIGQTFYLDKREVVLEIDPATTAYEQNRSSSDLVLDAAARLTRNWDIRTETLWNEDHGKRDRQSAALRYRDEKGQLFNLGYQYLDRIPTINSLGYVTDRAVEQYYTSAVYPLNNQWSLIGHWNHDVTNSRELEAIGGVQYDNCCWSVQVVARQWIVNDQFTANTDTQQTDNGIFLQVQLKSLGNVGDSVDDLLSHSITGYEDRNKSID